MGVYRERLSIHPGLTHCKHMLLHILSLLYRTYSKIHWLISGGEPNFEAGTGGQDGWERHRCCHPQVIHVLGVLRSWYRDCLGLHAAMSPEEAKIQDSTLYNPTIDESKSLLKLDFTTGQGYFAIASFALLVITIILGLSCWCGCTPAKLTKKKEERAWKMEIKELMQRHNQQEVEEGLKAEGWIEVDLMVPDPNTTWPPQISGGGIEEPPGSRRSIILATNLASFIPLTLMDPNKGLGWREAPVSNHCWT